MVKNFWQNKLILSLTLIVVMLLLLISACNLIDLGGSQTQTTAVQPAVLAPLENAKVLAKAPVQIQSLQPNAEISRVELLVQGPNSTAETLVRADKPTDGVVLQQWTPQQAGQYIVKVRTYDINNVMISELPRTIEVVDDKAISLAMVATPTPLPNPPAQPTSVLATPAPTIVDTPGTGGGGGEEFRLAAVTPTSTPSPSPTPFYPPPPPAPGIPFGPVQSPQLNVHPPVCDAAEYLGPYVPPTTQDRIFITEDDMVAVKAVGGTKVHRAWLLRNTGTCTWGPGYELAYYGGRSMGSGGVAFEGYFGEQPDRRNIVESSNRLIVPEGKPNEVAVPEVFLNVPAIPGIHQSYWRMRNPQGVYFGPIVGVTMEVIRECQLGTVTNPIYGAPTINDFRIISVGTVFNPVNPLEAEAFLSNESADVVVLQWSVINADNYDVIVRKPVGGSYNLKTKNFSDRGKLIPDQVGDYVVRLYADNGACAGFYTNDIVIHVKPGATSKEFKLNVLFGADAASAGLTANDMMVQWEHPDSNADNFVLRTQLIKTSGKPQCTSTITQCTGDWWSIPALQSLCQSLFCSAVQGTVVVSATINVGDAAIGSAAVPQVADLCKQAQDPSSGYFLRFQMFVDAEPDMSNIEERACPKETKISGSPSVEIPSTPTPVTILNP